MDPFIWTLVLPFTTPRDALFGTRALLDTGQLPREWSVQMRRCFDTLQRLFWIPGKTGPFTKCTYESSSGTQFIIHLPFPSINGVHYEDDDGLIEIPMSITWPRAVSLEDFETLEQSRCVRCVDLISLVDYPLLPGTSRMCSECLARERPVELTTLRAIDYSLGDSVTGTLGHAAILSDSGVGVTENRLCSRIAFEMMRQGRNCVVAKNVNGQDVTSSSFRESIDGDRYWDRILPWQGHLPYA